MLRAVLILLVIIVTSFFVLRLMIPRMGDQESYIDSQTDIIEGDIEDSQAFEAESIDIDAVTPEDPEKAPATDIIVEEEELTLDENADEYESEDESHDSKNDEN